MDLMTTTSKRRRSIVCQHYSPGKKAWLSVLHKVTWELSTRTKMRHHCPPLRKISGNSLKHSWNRTLPKSRPIDSSSMPRPLLIRILWHLLWPLAKPRVVLKRTLAWFMVTSRKANKLVHNLNTIRGKSKKTHPCNYLSGKIIWAQK